MTAPVITGGSINGTTIGATTASTGAFSTLSATGVTTVQAGTVSAPAITTTGDTNTGIFFPAADTIAFTEGGAEAMRIDSSGNVGIGITTMVGKLNVNATGNNSRIAIGDTAASTYSTLLMYGGSGKYNFQLGVQNNVNNAFEITPSTAVDGTTFSTPAMVINSSGNLLVGTTTAAGKITVDQTTTGERGVTSLTPAAYSSAAFRSISGATASTNWYHFFGSSSSDTVSNIIIYGNGNIENANNSYGAISDIKLKENIVDATPKLNKLMQVKVRNYNLKSNPNHKQLGVIAQELETVFPNLIEETQDRGVGDELLETTTKSVKYSVFVPMLIKAMQELKATVDAQTARIAALENPSVEN
jgi:hypothetical protein